MKRSNSPCFCINLRRAAGVLSDFYDKSLAGAHLTTSQLSLLRSLSRIQPCTVTALADAMGLERTTLVRTMKPLVERGLVRDLALAKSRNKLLALTEDGSERMEYGSTLWEEAQESVKAYMGAEQMATLMGLLAQLEELTKSSD